MVYGTKVRGSKYSNDYEMYITKDDKIISPFHDISLKAGISSYHAVIEIPRFESAKFEMTIPTEMNPIKQDVKKGKPRFVHNLFPHHGFIFNYGAFPQTYEDPEIIEETTGAMGDKDPLDFIEIGSKQLKTGEVVAVKILGCLCFIDSGEIDWKIIGISVDDPLFSERDSLEKVKRNCPGLLSSIREWLRNYKVPAGKSKGSFGYNEEFLNAEFAENVIKENHESWKKVFNTKPEGISLTRYSEDKDFIIKEEEISDTDKPESTTVFSFVE